MDVLFGMCVRYVWLGFLRRTLPGTPSDEKLHFNRAVAELRLEVVDTMPQKSAKSAAVYRRHVHFIVVFNYQLSLLPLPPSSIPSVRPTPPTHHARFLLEAEKLLEGFGGEAERPSRLLL